MKKLTLFLSAMLLACATNLWAVDFSQTYSYVKNGPSGWSLTNFEDKGSYYLVPSGKDTSVATIPGIFTDKTITSDVVVTLNVATYNSGTNPSASTFSLYTSTDCTTQVTATQGGKLPTSSTYTDVTYTVSKENAAKLTKDLAIKITKPGKQIRLNSIKVAFSYKTSTSATLSSLAISIPEGVQLKKEYIVGTGFDVTGIKAIATYDDASEEDVTEDVTWTLNPETFESVAENASVKVTASIDGEKSNELEITGITVRNLYNYTITWLDKNETFKTTTVTEGDALVLPATNPTCETKEFVGWTASETIPENATIEAMAFVNETTIPVADATYRAVFAKVTKDESKSVELTHSSLKLSGSYAKITATVGGIGFTIDEGFKGSVNSNAVIQMNSSKGNGILYNTTAISGLESITLNVASGTNVTTIYQGTAQQPSTNEAGKTGTTATISFAKDMTYFCLKVSAATYFSSIVINYTPVAYSEFSFTCPSTPSDIERVSVPATTVQKTIENGQLVILRDGVKYNAMGVRLQ